MFRCPSIPQSLIQPLGRDAELLGPFTDQESFSIECQRSIASPIHRLLFLCSPPTISRLIISIVVYTINLTAIRPWPHIIKECRKGISPSIAHANASSAIILPAFVSRILASLSDTTPRLKFFIVSYGKFSMHAIVRSISQSIGARSNCLVTNAATFPKCSIAKIFRSLNNCQIIKALTSQINQLPFCHTHLITQYGIIVTSRSD